MNVAPHYVYSSSIADLHRRLARLQEDDQAEQWQAAIDWANRTLAMEDLTDDTRQALQDDISFYQQRLSSLND